MRTFHLTLAVLSVVALASSSFASGPDRHHRRHVLPSVTRNLERDAAAPCLDSIAGTWVVESRDGSYRDVKARIGADGTFCFTGSSWSSRGKVRVDGHSLCLEWTEIDGEAVEPGTVKKAYEICSDNCSFRIDNFLYRKESR